MKVILLEDTHGLGRVGDIVTVKDGYARNYLIPGNKARVASPANMKILDVLKKKRVSEEKKKLDEANAVAARISAMSLTIAAQAGEEEKLFGSITSEKIKEALEAEGVKGIDKKDILLEEPIKQLGVYEVGVKIHPEVKAKLRLWVVKE